jgi:Flp pilus assembly protein TadD
MRQLFFSMVAAIALSSLAGPASAASAASYRQQGIARRNQGDLSGAITALQQAVQLEPENLAGRLSLGWTLHLAKQGEAAVEVLEETIWLDPFHPQTFNALGIVYLVNDDLAAAVLTHNWAVLIQPDNKIAHYNLSLAYHRLGYYDWAITSAETATELEPENPHPWVALAIAHWGNGDTAMAQEIYRQTVQMDARYGDRQFLTYLNQSGFSDDQIAIAQGILAATVK